MSKLKILTDVLGSYHKSGNEHLFICPFDCSSYPKKKLSVNLRKNCFKCWVCNAAFRSITPLVKKFGNSSQLQSWMALSDENYYHSSLSDLYALFENEIEESAAMDLPNEFVSLSSQVLNNHGKRALQYVLSDRLFTYKDILLWKVGYCAYGKYGGRVVIPSLDTHGNVNYFVSRAYNGHWRRYLNPRKGRNIIFNEMMINWNEDVVLVEGAFDAMRIGRNAVPLLGSVLNEYSLLFRRILEHKTRVFMALDSDAIAKQRKIIDKLLQYDVEVYKINVEEGDVADMTRSEFFDLKNRATLQTIENWDIRLEEMLA